MTSAEAIQEDRKIHKVQTLVDFAMHVLAHGDLTRADAVQLVEQVRARVLLIFPESADTFDVLYGRRFEQLVATCPDLPPANPSAVRESRGRHVH